MFNDNVGAGKNHVEMVPVMLNGKVVRLEARLDSLICCRSTSPPVSALVMLSLLRSSVSPKFPSLNISYQTVCLPLWVGAEVMGFLSAFVTLDSLWSFLAFKV